MNLHQHYRRLRALGHVALSAMRDARTAVAWEKAERTGLVRLDVVPDEEMYDDSYIDTRDDVSQATRDKMRAKLWKTIEREGVYGLRAQLRVDGRWQDVDTCWGFIGDDWKDSGYDSDLMRAALDALDEQRSDEAAELATRATFAGVA